MVIKNHVHLSFIQYCITIFVLGCSFCLYGCANFYEGLNVAGKENCYKLSYSDQDDCLQDFEQDYNQYEQARMEAIKKKGNKQ